MKEPVVFAPMNSGPCVKAHVTAVLVTADGDVFKSTNFCRTPQETCPRETQGFAPGEGYHLCRDVCGQRGHAEVNVIDFAAGFGLHKVRDAKLYVDYDLKVEAAVSPARVCGECQSYAKDAGVREVVLGKPTGYMPLSHAQRQWGNYQRSREILLAPTKEGS